MAEEMNKFKFHSSQNILNYIEEVFAEVYVL